jgi:hypothetical protein
MSASASGRLATLGRFLFIWFAGRLRWRRCATAKFGNRSQQLSTVPQRDANLFKIRIRQIAQHLDINIVIDKYRRISFQANIRQPFRNLLHGRPCADLPATGGAAAYQF